MQTVVLFTTGNLFPDSGSTYICVDRIATEAIRKPLCPCHTTVYLPAYADVWGHVG